MNSILKENETNIEKIIDQKRLQLNYIWANKITQEEINQLKKYDSAEEVNKQIKIIVNSISKLAEKINESFIQIFDDKTDFRTMEFKVNKLILYSSSIIQKMKNLNDVKMRNYKLDNEIAENLNKIIKIYRQIKISITEKELSTKFNEIYEGLVEQMELLTGES